MPALAHALPQDARKPSSVQAPLRVVVRMTSATRVALSSIAFNGLPTGILTRRLPLVCRCHEPRNVVVAPQLVSAVRFVKSSALLARVDGYPAAVLGNGEHAGEHRPSVVGLA